MNVYMVKPFHISFYGSLVALGGEIVADINKPATDRKAGSRHSW